MNHRNVLYLYAVQRPIPIMCTITPSGVVPINSGFVDAPRWQSRNFPFVLYCNMRLSYYSTLLFISSRKKMEESCERMRFLVSELNYCRHK